MSIRLSIRNEATPGVLWVPFMERSCCIYYKRTLSSYLYSVNGDSGLALVQSDVDPLVSYVTHRTLMYEVLICMGSSTIRARKIIQDGDVDDV